MAGPTIKFTVRLRATVVTILMANCKAFFLPGYVAFGSRPVVAQAAGRPLFACAAGGALDTVIANETGLFFQQQTVDSLVDAIESLEKMHFDPQKIRQNAERFGTERFKTALRAWIQQAVSAS
jgi:glycosyltransferase involved in cell wall biosynthesis